MQGLGNGEENIEGYAHAGYLNFTHVGLVYADFFRQHLLGEAVGLAVIGDVEPQLFYSTICTRVSFAHPFLYCTMI